MNERLTVNFKQFRSRHYFNRALICDTVLLITKPLINYFVEHVNYEVVFIN